MADSAATKVTSAAKSDHAQQRVKPAAQLAGFEAKLQEPAVAQPRAGNRAVAHALGAGAPLDDSICQEMQSRYGADFSNVRVHTDASAAQSAEGLHASAYAIGSDIVFGPGHYAPYGREGKRLLAHELAHVIQQSRGGARPALDSNAMHEQQADRAADAVSRGESAVAVEGATAPGLACKSKKEEEEEEKAKSQANMTVITQRPSQVKPLDLPVTEINDPNKGKGVLGEAGVPFDRYSGFDWNHIAGGGETASSRTNVARQSSTDVRLGQEGTAGIDFIVENVKTGQLVIGEQKATKGKEFTSTTAITTNLEVNLAHTAQTLQKKIDSGQIKDPAEVARLQKTIDRLTATRDALAKRQPLPEGVVFELTNVNGKGEQIGKEHIDNLAKKYKDKPEYLDHLLSRTFVRDKTLAQGRGRDPAGTKGTASDPNVVPAADILTPQASDELARLRSGKTTAQWRKQKADQQAAEKKAASKAREDARKARSDERKAAAAKARAGASERGKQAQDSRAQQLKQEAIDKAEPEPRTKRARDQAERGRQRAAKQAGKAEENKAVEDFLQKRAQDEAAAKAKEQAQAQKRQQESAKQRQAEAEAGAKRKADAKDAADVRAKAIQDAKKTGSLDTPDSIRQMNDAARQAHQAQKRDANLGKAAKGVNQAAAGIRAFDAYEDARAQGKGQIESGLEATKTYLDNTNVVMGAFANAEAKQRKDEKGEQYYGNDAVDAWLGTIGETGAGFVVPGSGVDQAVNAVSNFIGATDDHMKKGQDPNAPGAKDASVRNVTDVVADVTPSRMFAQVMGGGLRAWRNVGQAATGDFKGVDKFGEDATRGKLGSIIQPFAMAADFAGNLGGTDVSTALNQTLDKSKDTNLAKIGNKSGDLMYELGESTEAKSGRYGSSLATASTMLGMTSDMIVGKTFNEALEKAASEGSMDAKGAIAVRDAAAATSAKAKEVWNEDIPAAREKAGAALTKVSAAIDNAADATAEKATEVWNEDIPAMKQKAGETVDKVEEEVRNAIDDPGAALDKARGKLGRLWDSW